MSKLVGRLFACHRRRSVSALLLSLLAAGTEGMGLLLLIPLLALAGISSEQSSAWIEWLRLDRLGLDINVYVVLLLFLCLLTLRQFVVYRQRMACAQIRFEFSHRLRGDLFAALVNARWRFFSEGVFHRQVQILTLESARAGNAAQQCFGLVTSCFVMAIHVGIAALLSIAYTVAILTGILLLALAMRGRLARTAQTGTRVVGHHESLYALTSNFLPMLRTAKMAGATRSLTDRFLARSGELNETLQQYAAGSAGSMAILQLLAAALLASSVVVGVQLMALDAVTILVLVLIFARLTPLLVHIQQVGHQLVHDLPAVRIALDNVRLWQDRAEARATVSPPPLQPPRRSIELRRVFAGYAGEEGGQVLRDVSFRIPIGRLTLVWGPTGAGKSTLADVIAGLLQPSAGTLLLDGRALSGEQLTEWRARVGYVEQAATLFTGTIRENLIWGADSVDPAWLERVVAACMVADFVADLPGGLDASVGEGGARLSGGQRQRIAIARELVRRPILLVLDEATSGLDEGAESTLLRRISELDAGLTIMLISHRSTAIKHADHVLEIERGYVKSCTTRRSTLRPSRSGVAG